ncbi:MAG: glycoside hydrolase family 9 protein [Fibrobacterota bacterium]
MNGSLSTVIRHQLLRMAVPIFCLALFITAENSEDNSGTQSLHLRCNQAGYRPQRPKSLVIMSQEDQAGVPWQIIHEDDTVLSGIVAESQTGAGDHTSHAYNHVVDFSSLTDSGTYDFCITDKSTQLHITPHPYSAFITDALRHLRVVRSGENHDRIAGKTAHGGDSAAILHTPRGDVSQGEWEQVEPRRTVDMSGGWYDAGDYIKFTLTNATTAYYLLEAYEANPMAFTSVLSSSDLPDVLEEARFGLTYLMKTHPEEDIFIVQVGDARDHHQGTRLPEQDPLNGKRPAHSAISPVHMGITAATLAKGSRIFDNLGKKDEAAAYLSMAEKIMSRALAPDAHGKAVFERDKTNDYYRDNTLYDNMALAALELFKTTGDSTYLNQAQSYPSKPAEWISWGQYNFNVNFGLRNHHAPAEEAAREDIIFFLSSMDSLWGIPLHYSWASVHTWNGAGAAAGAWYREYGDTAARNLHLKMVDLLFGRNNWGISFMASTRLPRTFQNVYNQIYELTGDFPHGAVALGPAGREIHTDMEQWFGTPPATVLDSFQTDAAVFHDWERDFVTSETISMSQAYAIWLLSIASDHTAQAPADSTLPSAAQTEIAEDLFRWKAELNTQNWYPFSDENSTAEWTDQNAGAFVLTPKEGVEYPYAGYSITIPEEYTSHTPFSGLYLYGSFKTAVPLRINLTTPAVLDYDYHGKNILGTEDAALRIPFDELKQQGFGKSRPFQSETIQTLNLQSSNITEPAHIQIDSLVFYR